MNERENLILAIGRMLRKADRNKLGTIYHYISHLCR